MESIYTRYQPLVNNGTGATHLKIALYYILGGVNGWTYRTEPRGYYISVTPVRREPREWGFVEQFTAFSGVKECVNAVARKSKPAENRARLLAEDYIPVLVSLVCDTNGIKCVTEAERGINL